MPENDFDLVGVGIFAWDIAFLIPEAPKFEHTVESKAINQEGGGPACTGAATASKMGADTAVMGKVGDDDTGDKIIDDLENYGVGTGHMKRKEGGTSWTAIVLVEEGSGNRGFMVHEGNLEISPEDISEDVIKRSDYLLIDGNYPELAHQAAKYAQDAETKVVSDLEHQIEKLPEIISLTDILIVPENFAENYTGLNDPEEASEHLLSEGGPEITIITLGEDGLIGRYDDTVFRKPIFPVDVVDTTGAGDVFHGAFIRGLMEGWDYEKSAEFASAASALSCRVLGGRSGIPDFEETLQFLSERSDNW